ncbi:TPA: hypothetical protein ACH3X3_008462 [Trebouxia sp. C0006]
MTPTLHLVWHIASAPCVGHWDKNAPHLLVRAHLSKPKEAQGSSVAGTCARLIDAIVALGSPATKGMWDVPGVGTTAADQSLAATTAWQNTMRDNTKQLPKLFWTELIKPGRFVGHKLASRTSRLKVHKLQHWQQDISKRVQSM